MRFQLWMQSVYNFLMRQKCRSSQNCHIVMCFTKLRLSSLIIHFVPFWYSYKCQKFTKCQKVHISISLNTFPTQHRIFKTILISQETLRVTDLDEASFKVIIVLDLDQVRKFITSAYSSHGLQGTYVYFLSRQDKFVNVGPCRSTFSCSPHIMIFPYIWYLVWSHFLTVLLKIRHLKFVMGSTYLWLIPDIHSYSDVFCHIFQGNRSKFGMQSL